MQYLAYILFAIILIIVALQLSMFLKAKRQQGKPVPEVDELLSDEQRKAGRLLFYFYSEQCGPCRAVTRLIDKLSKTHGNIVKVDVMQRPDIARRFSVMGTPTLIQIESGQISHVHIGGITEAKLTGMV